MGLGIAERESIARRAASEVTSGMIVNLGIGIPSLVPNFLPAGMEVMLQAENGVLGIGGSPERGEEDELLCNAAGFPVSTVKGASYFDSALSFAMIRKGLIDITILGALQVSRTGDLANWLVPGKKCLEWAGRWSLPKARKSSCRHEPHRSERTAEAGRKLFIAAYSSGLCRSHHYRESRHQHR